MSVIRFSEDAWVVRSDEGSPRDDALRIASALGAVTRSRCPGSTVYVGYDTRALSQGVAVEVGDVIASYGLRARVSDVHCPTSALCEATRRDPEASSAIMLTADNRSADYFGVRVRMADGSPATSADSAVIEDGVPPEVPRARGASERVDLITRYLEGLSLFVGGEGLRARSPIVVCDPMHGAMSSHAARLLGSLGARVVEVHGGGKADFGGLHPEAAEPWIDDCEQAVIDHAADLGVALDGAGNRIALVDERGKLVSPHIMLALVMEHLVRVRGLSGRMVAPIFVSTIVRRQARRLGLPLTITPAGFVWMREEMAAGDVVCAGDALGGICIPSVGFERDALATAAILCEVVAMDSRPLSQIVAELDAELGHMDYGRRDVRMGSGSVQVLRNALPGLNPAELAGMRPVEVSHPGGLMLRFDDESWVLVRPSRAFSIARVYAEAPDPASRDRLLDAATELALSPLS